MRLGSQERKRVRDKRGVSDGEVQRMKQRLLKMVRRRRLSEGEEGPQRRKRSVREGGKRKTTERKNREKKRATKKIKLWSFPLKETTRRNYARVLCHKGLQVGAPYARGGNGQ